MKESKLIKHLPTIGRIFTPAAMLVVLTYEITKSQTVTGGWAIAILVGAAATAVGVEAVGIMAGHTFEAYWRVGDGKRAWLALALLGIYTGAGVWILWDNAALIPIPIIAAVVYLVSGLAESLTAQQSKEAVRDEQQTAFELEQQAKDRENRRLLDRQKLEADTAVKLARVEAKARETKPKAHTESAKHSPENAVNLGELTGNKLQIYTLFQQKPNATNTEIAETVGVSRQYVGQVKKELNGALT